MIFLIPLAAALTAAAAINADINTGLEVVKPINEVACIVRPWKPKSDEAKAAVDAFCANLPDSTIGAVVQIGAIVEAIDAAHEKK